jgi:hypothetical protein
MTNRLVRYYGTLDPYEIPTVIGLPIIFIATPLLVYSIYSVHIDLFINFGGILGSVYWPILIYLSIETYRSQKRPWSFWQKFVWWQTVIASPFIAAIIGAFYFGIFYPIWNAINWLSVASRTIIRTLIEEVWMGSVPIFHRLHRRLAFQC